MTTFTDPLEQLNQHAVALEQLIETIMPPGVHREQAMIKLAEMQMWILVGSEVTTADIDLARTWPSTFIIPG